MTEPAPHTHWQPAQALRRVDMCNQRGCGVAGSRVCGNRRIVATERAEHVHDTLRLRMEEFQLDNQSGGQHDHDEHDRHLQQFCIPFAKTGHDERHADNSQHEASAENDCKVKQACLDSVHGAPCRDEKGWESRIKIASAEVSVAASARGPKRPAPHQLLISISPSPKVYFGAPGTERMRRPPKSHANPPSPPSNTP